MGEEGHGVPVSLQPLKSGEGPSLSRLLWLVGKWGCTRWGLVTMASWERPGKLGLSVCCFLLQLCHPPPGEPGGRPLGPWHSEHRVHGEFLDPVNARSPYPSASFPKLLVFRSERTGQPHPPLSLSQQKVLVWVYFSFCSITAEVPGLPWRI